jgi:hypothetical protein
MVNIEKWTIEETGNALSKITSSERGTFLLIMAIAFASIVATVILYIRSVDWLIEKYNETINKQQTEFLQALKEFSK